MDEYKAYQSIQFFYVTLVCKKLFDLCHVLFIQTFILKSPFSRK